MSELSEEAYSAGWMERLEYELWAALITGPRDYGRLRVTSEHIAHLRQLSHVVDGWIAFDDTNEETLLPLPEWEKRFAIWKQENPTPDHGP